MSQYLQSLKKEEKKLFDTYSNKKTTGDKIAHLTDMIETLKLIKQNGG